mmetsp:Transcript_114284/g.243747  ORF Transcript_114284/g.243747 Transcript_114284/m.243747 type:complete len:108 (+) Transcript_114284:116-439(+)
MQASMLPKLLSSGRVGMKKGDAMGETEMSDMAQIFRTQEVEVPSPDKQPIGKPRVVLVGVPKGATPGSWVAFIVPDQGFGPMERMALVPPGVKLGDCFEVDLDVSSM